MKTVTWYKKFLFSIHIMLCTENIPTGKKEIIGEWHKQHKCKRQNYWMNCSAPNTWEEIIKRYHLQRRKLHTDRYGQTGKNVSIPNSSCKTCISLDVSILLYKCEIWTYAVEAERMYAGVREQMHYKAPPHFLLGANKQTIMYGARLKVLRAHMNLSSPLLSVWRCHGFCHITRHNSPCNTIIQDTAENGHQAGMVTQKLVIQHQTTANRSSWRKLSSFRSPWQLKQSRDWGWR